MKVGSLVSILILIGCAQGIESPTNPPIQNLNALSIIESNPAPDTANVPLDQQILLTFNQKIDAYSAHHSNFIISTRSGNLLPGKPFVSSSFVPHPQDPNKLVSQIKIVPDTPFSPEQEYFVAWRQSLESADDPLLSGVQSLTGDRLLPGFINFTVSDRVSDFARPKLEVFSMSPGRIMKSNYDSVNSYISFNKRSPIVITFTEAAKQLDYDFSNQTYPDIPPTPIENFPGLYIGIIDASSIESVFSALPENWNDTSAWDEFLRTKVYNRLKGKIYTTNNRRTLIYELNNDCFPVSQCEYPDTGTKGVVVVLRGWQAINTRQMLDGSGNAVGFFIQDSGYQFGEGFDELPFNFGGGE